MLKMKVQIMCDNETRLFHDVTNVQMNTAFNSFVNTIDIWQNTKKTTFKECDIINISILEEHET